MFPLLLIAAGALATTSYTTIAPNVSTVPDTNLRQQVVLIVIQKLYFIVSLF